jgi:hypothetical protein
MTDFLKMDIFFVVATIATALVGILVLVALVFFVRILRTFDRILLEVEAETKAIREDIEDTRMEIKRDGKHLLHFLGLAKKVGARAKKKRATESE